MIGVRDPCHRAPEFGLDGVVPASVFTLDRITIGVSTIEDVNAIYGKVGDSPVNPNEDESDETVCYAAHSRRGSAEIVFETGAMGGYTDITGFRISTRSRHTHCTRIELDMKRVRALPIKFKRRGSELRHEGLTRRAATTAE